MVAIKYRDGQRLYLNNTTGEYTSDINKATFLSYDKGPDVLFDMIYVVNNGNRYYSYNDMIAGEN